MSEVLQPPHLELEQTPQNIQPRLVGDAGSIDFGEMRVRAGELVGTAVDSAQLAYHGLASRVSEIRREMADTRVERLDHKDTMYASQVEAIDQRNELRTKRVALNKLESRTDFLRPHEVSELNRLRGEVSSLDVDTVEPRSRSEAIKIRRLEKKQFKREYKQAKRDTVIKAYSIGGEGKTKSNTMGSHTRIEQARRKSEINKDYKNGNISARERREQIFQSRVELPASENPEQKKSRRKVDRASERVERETNQPVLSRWRSSRKSGAVKYIKRQQRRTERRDAAQAIRERDARNKERERLKKLPPPPSTP